MCGVFLQGYERGKDRLVVTTCPNQDPLQPTTGKVTNTIKFTHFTDINFHESPFLKIPL